MSSSPPDLTESAKAYELSRRGAIASGVVALAVVANSTQAAQGLRAVISLGGKTYDFAAASGEDMGDFKSEIGGFTQKCIRVVRSELPLTVFFRPDSTSERVEVVFELGRIWKSEPKHLDAYTATILNDDAELAKVEVPKHFWFSRWRWQSEPRPIVGDIQKLIADHLLPPFAVKGDKAPSGAPGAPSASVAKDMPASAPKAGLPGAPKITDKGLALGLGAAAPRAGGTGPAPLVYEIMGLAGVTPFMGQTGERPDIGLVTSYQADYIFGGDKAGLAIVRAQAEAAGTVPWHLRDEKTGAPINLDDYPKASWYPSPAGADPSIQTLKSDVDIDAAHQPSLAYLPFLLTGDPYHLEDMQFADNWNRGCLPPLYRLSIPQVRAVAWSLRTLAQCAKVTPDKVPRWLLPRAYWKTSLDRFRQWLEATFMGPSAPGYAVLFHQLDDPTPTRGGYETIAFGTAFSPWQDEFIGAVIGWLILMGFTEWRNFYNWKIENTLVRTAKDRGWVRGHCTPYRIVVRDSDKSPYYTTWAQAYAATAKAWGFKPTQDPEHYEDEDPTYLFYTRGALVIADKLGVAAASEPLTWANSQVARRNLKIPTKWNIA